MTKLNLTWIPFVIYLMSITILPIALFAFEVSIFWVGMVIGLGAGGLLEKVFNGEIK